MGKFYDMINDFHDSSKKWDPITHYTLDWTHDASTKSVGETSHGIGKLFGDTWLGNAGKHWDQMADKDKADFGRWGGNTAMSAAAIYGAMSGASALGGEGAAGGGSGAWTGTGAGDGGMLTLAGEGGSTTAATGLAEPAGAAGAGGGWMEQLMGSMGGGSGGGSGGSSGSKPAPQPTGYGQPGSTSGGNPALTEALARLVSEQEQTSRQQKNPFLSALGSQTQRPMQSFGQQDRFSQFLPMIQGDQNGRTY